MELTHFNESGHAKMVDVSGKAATLRTAAAAGFVSMTKETLALVKEGRIKKGDVLSVAQVAGIMAAKKTSDLIPMCHPLAITGADQPRHIGRTHPRPHLVPQCTEKGRKPALKIGLPVLVHGRPSIKPTTHESRKPRRGNPKNTSRPKNLPK